jgi:hypothetical protein
MQTSLGNGGSQQLLNWDCSGEDIVLGNLVKQSQIGKDVSPNTYSRLQHSPEVVLIA